MESYKIQKDRRQNFMESLSIQDKMLRDLIQDSKGLDSIPLNNQQDNTLKNLKS